MLIYFNLLLLISIILTIISYINEIKLNINEKKADLIILFICIIYYILYIYL
jgi:hypothetical protein